MKVKVALVFLGMISFLLVSQVVHAQGGQSNTGSNQPGRNNTTWMKLHDRQSLAIRQLESLIRRYERIAAQLKAQGRDTSVIDQKVTDAKVKLAAIKGQLAATESRVSSAPANGNAQQFVATVKRDLQPTRKDLRELHNLLKGTAKDIREARKLH